jgi:predicted lipoprotein with Yx(FWY)xxD motif
MKKFNTRLFLIAVLSASGPLLAADNTTSGLTAANQTITGDNGMSTYFFDKDTANSGISACYGKCATLWPPVPADQLSDARDYGKIQRNDGFEQLTYQGKPLYFFVKDKKPGDITGDEVKNIWHLAKTVETPVAESASGY